jgi:hypothetical protein
MRRQHINAFFGGAVTTMVMMVVLLMAQTTAAQDSLAQPEYPLEVAVTYGATMSNPVGGSGFWMQNGSAQVQYRFYRGLGVVADVAGMHSAIINSSGAGLNLITFNFGPRYTWSSVQHKKYAFFGQMLVGDAHGFDSVFPTQTGTAGSANSLAIETGGGMNLALLPRIAVRVFEADWLRTQLPNSTTNVQNNLILGAGIVLRFR